MSYQVEQGSAQWASEDQRRLSLMVQGDGETAFHKITISKGDPSAEFAALFDQATADPPAFGAIADYVEPPPVEISTSTPLILPPVQAPAPAIPPPPPPIDWDAEAQRFIAAIYTVRGQNVRGSMNTWAAAVALTPEDQRTNFDKTCAEMVPALNAWEGAVFAERDRVRAIEGATLDDLRWPILPPGASQFIEWCAAP